ncbi:hypothetical protein R2083_14395 [Nitrosomonas sp. Is35]|uniref:hypothetical protein n=1 Tax=Nitrosomonas sp. Is35 TaxID=3080534 RepID=UPI00294A9BE5|nr:hypothetical protein [Nitrosomonas sp. Is35]MDV6348708.1 hypothetical protein [Nitrosomonas sp. Is35]
MSISVESTSSLWVMRVFKVIFSILFMYFAYTLFVTIDRLNSSPSHIFDSKVIKPTIKLYSKENLSTEVSNEDNIKFIAIVTKNEDEGIKILIPKLVAPSIDAHSSLEELALQYASGSGLVYADHCRSTRYRHECTGPVYDGGKLVSEKTCSCVKSLN